ncbi:MAG: PHP domain-containing protein [Clostridia bacterium]|nr:PHP domain-containing protein [Clostridia bacterium]
MQDTKQTKSKTEILLRLNGPFRRSELKGIAEETEFPEMGRDINNHIHSLYSFSPYSPTAIAYFARKAGLCTCGLMDHDTLEGAEEFLEAAETVGIGATIGVECRVSFKNTPFAGRYLNSQDQLSMAYMTLQGIPHSKIETVTAFFAPLRMYRYERCFAMTERLNRLMAPYGIRVDFQWDVLEQSWYRYGGTVTERHIAAALARKMMAKYGKGRELLSFIRDTMHLPVSRRLEGYLLENDGFHVLYDLLGWVKSTLLDQFYIEATDELLDVQEMLEVSEEIGAISAYAYLGDVKDISTGDKRDQKYEDEFLDELVPYLKKIGFRAVTYMPVRNTPEQLRRIRSLCEQEDLLQISGVDINSTRQSFVCPQQRGEEFQNLYDAAWALIAHERLMDEDPEKGLFSASSETQWPKLQERAAAFAKKGLEMVQPVS